MRAWEHRPDTAVVDEPFYAHYLVHVDAGHPGRDRIIASQATDWTEVVDMLLGPVPGGRRIFYQKHMCHHFLPGMEGDWLAQLDNVFLLRDPTAMLASLAKVLDRPVLRDTGLEQQWHLFQIIRDRTGTTPMVIDSVDILKNPGAALSTLCRLLDIEFTDAMLSWPAGRRDSDGVWGEWWYSSVEESTGFLPYREKPAVIPDHLAPLLDQCQPLYDRMAAFKIPIHTGTT